MLFGLSNVPVTVSGELIHGSISMRLRFAGSSRSKASLMWHPLAIAAIDHSGRLQNTTSRPQWSIDCNRSCMALIEGPGHQLAEAGWQR